jgi:hypothetical protein
MQVRAALIQYVGCACGACDGDKGSLLVLRGAAIADRKLVACVHGDSHDFRVDKSFLEAAGRRREGRFIPLPQ